MIKSRYSILLTASILASTLTACGSTYSSYDSTEMATEEATDSAIYAKASSFEDSIEAPLEEADYNSGSSSTELSEDNVSSRKLIKNVYMDVETTDYAAFSEALNDNIAKLDGYVTNTNMWTDYEGLVSCSLTIRIPASKCDQLVSIVEDTSNLVSKDESLEDVTLRYTDLESHKKALLTEQDTLLRLMSQAEAVADIIEIEKRLSEVRYEIESMESQLRILQNQVDYSTIDLNVTEVASQVANGQESTMEMIARRFSNNFNSVIKFIKDATIGLIVSIPILVALGLFIAIIVCIIKVIMEIRKKIKSKKSDSNMFDPKN